MRRNKAAGGVRNKLMMQQPEEQKKPSSAQEDEDPEAITKLKDEINLLKSKQQIKFDEYDSKLKKVMPLIEGSDGGTDKKGKKNDLESRLNDKIF